MFSYIFDHISVLFEIWITIIFNRSSLVLKLTFKILNGILCILISVLIIFTIQIPGDIFHLILLIICSSILIVSIIRINIAFLFGAEMRRFINIWSVSQGRRCDCSSDWYGRMEIICIYILLTVLAERSRIVNWLIVLVSRKRFAVILMRFGLFLMQPFCFVDFILDISFVHWLFFFFFRTQSFCYKTMNSKSVLCSWVQLENIGS